MVNKKREEHSKDFFRSIYYCYTEEIRFKQLKDFVNSNNNRFPSSFISLINDSNWEQSDRPDWVNAKLNVGIEDTVVEDTEHFLNKYLSQRSSQMKKSFKALSEDERLSILNKSKVENAEKIAKSGKLVSLTYHISSSKTVLEVYNHRSLYNWKNSIQNALEKHRVMLQKCTYLQKFIFIYDLTPSYLIESAVSRKGYIWFDPTKDKTIINLFNNYPANIIWYLKNQDIVILFDSKGLQKHNAYEINYDLVHP